MTVTPPGYGTVTLKLPRPWSTPQLVLEGIVDTGQVLTLTTLEAIKYGFCEGEAATVEEALKKAGIKEYTIRELKLTAG